MTISEENYIKVIYHLSLVSPKGVNTNAIAGMLETKASSVTDMLKKLSGGYVALSSQVAVPQIIHCRLHLK